MTKLWSKLRIPSQVQGIQVNHCKNPSCDNFKAPPAVKQKRDGFPFSYTLSGGKSSVPVIKCLQCNQHSSLKSNLGVHEEFSRIRSKHQYQDKNHSCKNIDCTNYNCSIKDFPDQYSSYGFTRSGSRRHRCKLCKRTFSISTVATFRQKSAEKNNIIFRLLMNKMPMRRICETAEIHPATLYKKIEFIHRQCQRFAGAHERDAFQQDLRRRFYISTDKQDYMLNWGSQLDRRNTRLHAIGSADNISGFVIGMHLGYDHTLDSERVEKEAEILDDYSKPIHFRRYARLWLQRDYYEQGRPHVRDVAVELNDSEITSNNKRPAIGIQTRIDYTAHGHFFFLQELLGKIEKIRFYLDSEPEVKAAVLSAFRERIVMKEVEAFYVRMEKGLTVDQRGILKARGQQIVDRYAASDKSLTQKEIEVKVLSELLRSTNTTNLSTSWIAHPFSTMNEPEKKVLWLTQHNAFSTEHIAHLYRHASLRSIDRFFMVLRRRLSVFERPIHSANTNRRTWHGYSCYNPEVGMSFRAYFE